MNAIFKLLFIFCLSAISCKKDKDSVQKNYEAITRNDIIAREASLSTNNIVVSNSSGIELKPGSVIIFKSNLGLFGKMKINSIDVSQNYLLNIAAVVYNADGSMKKQTGGLTIRGTYFADMDELVESLVLSNMDFKNERINNTDTNLKPENGAKFAKYIF
jgi:hypothetical protein